MIAKIDSGASKNYFRECDQHVLTDIVKVQGPKVLLPDNNGILINKQGSIPLPNIIRGPARKGYILPGLKNCSLLSLGQFMDSGCWALVNKYWMNIYKDKYLVLQGLRNKRDGLWDIELPFKHQTKVQQTGHKPSETLNALIQVNKTKSELASYLHACLFSPCPATLQKAVRKNFLLTWPGIETINFDKYVGDSIATAKGHMAQERKNLRSTKQQVLPNSIDQTADQFPSYEPKSTIVFSTVVPYSPKGMAYGDLTGRFPHKSSRGNEYIYIVYDYDANAILAEAIPNRQARTITAAWERIRKRLTKNGHSFSHFVLDNEISEDLKAAFTKYEITFQCVPPHIHRRNAAERAIGTFKNHFLAGLASCHSKFPISEWDRLLPQAEITLNLLRQCRINPAISAYTYLYGQYNFNAHPMAPPGTLTLVHKKVEERSSWDFHCKTGWYVAPALQHYRCVQVYLPHTHSVVIADTVRFVQEKVPIPMASTEFLLRQAIENVLDILKRPNRLNIPSVMYGDTVKNAFTTIARLLDKDNPQSSKKSVPEDIPSEQRVPLLCPSIPTGSPALKPIPSIELGPEQRVPDKTRFTPPALPPMPTTWALNHIYDAAGKKLSIDALLQGAQADVWHQALDNELGRLSRGLPGTDITGTKTIDFISKEDIPRGACITYANMVCDERPLKKEQFRVRLTIGGDKLIFLGDTGSPAADLLETKLMANSIISDAHKGARCLNLDIKDFFLQSFLPRPEYMRIHSRYFSKRFRKLYNIDVKIAPDGYVYCIILRGMYGLKQAAILAYRQLVSHLRKYGYKPCEGTTGLWCHESRPTKFALCVDDFMVKYFTRDDATHLINALKDKYEITQDWSGENFCGLKFKWNYDRGFVDMSMPKYISKALTKFNHKPPKRPQHAPYKWSVPLYGRKVQMVHPDNPQPLLSKKEIRGIQSKVGTFLYYGRAVEPTILVALNDISGEQAKPTPSTKKDLAMLMDFLATYPNATIRYVAGTMQLKVESDASYLSVKNSRSRYAGHFYLESSPNRYNHTPQNGPIHTECAILKNVVCSAAEAECGGVFHNCHKALVIRRALQALGHLQTPTEVVTDNSTAASFVHSTMRSKRSKTWDMRWNWLRDKLQQATFRIKWEKGSSNKADYFSKHHPPSHHRQVRSDYILPGH